MSRRLIASLAAIAAVSVAIQVPAQADAQVYQVGAAALRIDPDAPGSPLAPGTAVFKGGNGLGDGSSPVSQQIGAAGKSRDQGEHISARAIVIDDGTTAVALVTAETQGMFAAYQRGIRGLYDIEQAVGAATAGRLGPANIIISNDHTHSGPDLIGAWGFVPDAYATFVGDQIQRAILQAYESRRPATIVAGADNAPDLIYNMTCTEALNQSADATYPNTVCNTTQEGKDSWVRVLQARDASGNVIATTMAYAAHATLGGGNGLHGDWPQFMSDKLSATYGGVGIALEGAVGRTQPCRPRCGFTDKAKPGYDIADRKGAYTTMLGYHVERALLNAPAVSGEVKAAETFIRHEVSNPGLFALTHNGGVIGAPIARSLEAPWTVGNTVRTIVSEVRVGNLLIGGLPGEAYPNIPAGVMEAVNMPPQRTWTIGLADDQLGYLIAPVEAYPPIAAESAVNDNALFNISPTVGDHVMCAQIRMANAVGFATPEFRVNPRCVAWDAIDAAGDPLG
jgi:hypothetical protein